MADSRLKGRRRTCAQPSCATTFSADDSHLECYFHRGCPRTRAGGDVFQGAPCLQCHGWTDEQLSAFARRRLTRLRQQARSGGVSARAVSASPASSAGAGVASATTLAQAASTLDERLIKEGVLTPPPPPPQERMESPPPPLPPTPPPTAPVPVPSQADFMLAIQAQFKSFLETTDKKLQTFESKFERRIADLERDSSSDPDSDFGSPRSPRSASQRERERERVLESELGSGVEASPVRSPSRERERVRSPSPVRVRERERESIRSPPSLRRVCGSVSPSHGGVSSSHRGSSPTVRSRVSPSRFRASSSSSLLPELDKKVERERERERVRERDRDRDRECALPASHSPRGRFERQAGGARERERERERERGRSPVRRERGIRVSRSPLSRSREHSRVSTLDQHRSLSPASEVLVLRREMAEMRRRYESRSPARGRRVSWIDTLSPLRSPYAHMVVSPRAERSPRSLSPPVDMGSEAASKKEHELRTALKVLLKHLPDVSRADPASSSTEPEHFEIFRSASGRDRILLPPHSHVGGAFNFVQNSLMEDSSAKKPSSSSSSLDALKGAPFRPETSWKKVASMFDCGKAGIRSSKRLDDRAQPLFSFSSIQEFRRPLDQPLTLPRRTVDTLQRNASSGVAASSYHAHFMDAAREAAAELRSELVDSSRLSAVVDRLELFLKQASHAACYSSAFHAFTDAQFTLARRDQFVAKLKPYLKHHASALRSGSFSAPELFPNLDDILPHVQSDTQHQSVAALADYLNVGRGRNQPQSRQGRRRDSDGRSGRSGQGASSARSRSRDRSSPTRGQNRGRGSFRGSRNRGRRRRRNNNNDTDKSSKDKSSDFKSGGKSS